MLPGVRSTHSMGYLELLLISMISFLCAPLSAQYSEHAQTLSGIAVPLSSSLSVALSPNGSLTFEHRDDYDIVRKDRVLMDAIDLEVIAYDSVGVVSIPCKSGHAHCVQSTFFRMDQERRSSVLRLPTEDGNMATEALLQLIGQSLPDLVVSVETSSPPLRTTGIETDLDQ